MVREGAQYWTLTQNQNQLHFLQSSKLVVWVDFFLGKNTVRNKHIFKQLWNFAHEENEPLLGKE